MALDSRTKRLSMLAFSSPLPVPLFDPSGSVLDAGDRLCMLHLYRGIAAGVAVLVAVRQKIHFRTSLGI